MTSFHSGPRGVVGAGATLGDGSGTAGGGDGAGGAATAGADPGRVNTHVRAAAVTALTTATTTVSTIHSPRHSKSLAAARVLKRAAPSCSGIQPVTRKRTRSPMFTAWSPMRS